MVVDSEVDSQERGNQAAFEWLSTGERAPAPAPLDIVREAACPLVERAILALQIEPRSDGDVARFVEIVKGSALPEEQRALLVDRLVTDQAAAQGIVDAFQRWFAEDSPDLRAHVVGTLDGVMAGLQEGTERDAAWALPDGRLVSLGEATRDEGVSARADTLVRALAEQCSPPELGERLSLQGRSTGDAIGGFCRDVQLALLWDDEEEEEELGGETDQAPEGATS